MRNSEKTISANSKGIVIYYGDNKKHMFTPYRNNYVKKIQVEGTVKYQKLEEEFTPFQEKLYSTIIYGFSYYEKEQLMKMPESKKLEIKTNYTRARRLLNRWKQEIINEAVDGFLLNLFPKSKTAKQMVQTKGYDDEIDSSISFSDLGISKIKIAHKLIEFRLLPQNFFNLV